ncbi:MAG: nitrate- and nitrite sensing domain-containing protein [Pseudomonadota bacterium]
MNLRSKVALALALPVITAAVFLAILISRDLGTANDLAERGSVVGLVANASDLVHELQIERGRSLGAITGSYADRFVRALRDQRNRVDSKTEEFKRFVSQSGIGTAIPQLDPELRMLLSTLDGLGGMRNEVDAQSADPRAVIATYTGLIKDIVGVISFAVDRSPTREISNRLFPAVKLIEAKEHGGLERAFGGALFNQAAAGSIDVATFVDYSNQLVSEQGAIRRFRAFASVEHRELFSETVRGPAVEQIEKWRKVLATIDETVDGQGIDGKMWFDTATQRLDLIADVERRIIVEAINFLDAKKTELTNQKILKGTGGIGAMLLMLLLVFYAARSAMIGLSDVRGAIAALVDGETEIATVQRRDEVGEIVSGLENLALRMHQSAEAADRVSRGQLDGKIPIASDRDRLGHALQRMQSELRRVTFETGDAVRNLSVQASTLSSMASDVATHSHRQSEATDTAAASVEELDKTMQTSDENAAETSRTAGAAAASATDALEAVSEATQAVSEISQRVNLIQEIARQTDLLALNAAVEAARAGEHGRGFAIVAQQVRKLAEHSRETADEIDRLATRTVNAAGRAKGEIDRLAPEIGRTSKLTSEISGAMSEQKIGISQINDALNVLSEVNHQSKSLGQSSAEAARDVERLSERLEVLHAFFHAGHEGGGEAPASGRAAEPDAIMTSTEPGIAA